MIALITTFWFWLVVVEVIFLFAVLAHDKGTAASISLVIFAILLLVAGVDYISFFKTNPSYLIYTALIYFPIGIMWAIFKWFMLVLDRKTEYKEFKAEFLKNLGLDGLLTTFPMTQESVNNGRMTQEHLDKWKRSLQSSYSYRRGKNTIPQAREYKYDIMRWLGYWPFSLIWTLLSDFVKRVARAIYNIISGLLQDISDKIFADVKDDF
jgi:uncharacterized membrane protein YgaE (UPF0421/DUF939 family)